MKWTVCLGLSLFVLAPALCEGTESAFEPTPCPTEGDELEGVECGFLLVPERRDSPGGRTLSLAVAVLRSQGPDPAPDPLLFLSGGPGGSSVENVPARVRSPFWLRLRQDRDLIFFDQRGTGFSEPDFCPEMDRVIATVAYRGLSEAEVQAEKVRAVTACRERMRAQGVDPAAYHSVASARDVADLRRALGYDEWNLLGVSYGTRLALTVLREAPEGVRSVILDSTLPPDVSQWVQAGERFTRTLRRAFDHCAADPACREAFPSLEEDFYEVIADLEENPIVLSSPDGATLPDDQLVLDGTLWAQGIFQAFYDRTFVPVFPLVVRETKRRNLAVMRALAERIARDPDATRWGMNYAVNCYEAAPLNPPDRMLENRRRYPRLAPWLETGFNSPGIHAVCDAWHGARAEGAHLREVRSDVPALVLAGELDPITPPEYGRRAARTLPNATFVEVPAMGHAVSPFSECTRAIIDSFLEEPGRRPDTSCVAELPPVSFVTDVHLNPGVYRAASALRGGASPPVAALFGLLGLGLISVAAGWPAAAVLRRVRGRTSADPPGRGRAAARPLAALAAALAVGFLVGLAVTIRSTAATNPYVLAFGLPGEAAWLFALPWVVAVLTAAVAALAFRAWRRGWWTRAGRIRYALAAAVCVGFVTFVASLGLM